MQKSLKIIIFIIAVIVLGFLLFNFTDILKAPVKQDQVCYKKICFDVEVANTNAEREKGLMNREALKKNSGMFFVFDKEDIYPFWMKNTLISLDIIWLDKDGKVVFIKENAQPCIDNNCPFVIPNASAKYVLEINAGIVTEIGLKIGDNLDTSF